jgi:hypothetical protein
VHALNFAAEIKSEGVGISVEVMSMSPRVPCPASKLRRTCSNPLCLKGAACLKLRALGLAGDRSPLPRKKRPICGACNRRGKPCAVRVEPGKRRCRFHGGLSTGPTTTDGKARIAEAQRRRWIAFRREQRS